MAIEDFLSASLFLVNGAIVSGAATMAPKTAFPTVSCSKGWAWRA